MSSVGSRTDGRPAALEAGRVRVAVLTSGAGDETRAVTPVAARLRALGHEVRVGSRPTDQDEVRELCLGVDVVVGTAGAEEVAATMAEFTGVPLVVLLLEPRRRGHRAERARWHRLRDELDDLRRVLLLEPSRRPAHRAHGGLELYADVPAYVAGRIDALAPAPYRASQAAYASKV